jgi:hypothetical protein
MGVIEPGARLHGVSEYSPHWYDSCALVLRGDRRGRSGANERSEKERTVAKLRIVLAGGSFLAALMLGLLSPSPIEVFAPGGEERGYGRQGGH